MTLPPFVDEARADNAGVLAYFRRRNERGLPPCALPADTPDYLSLGSPDVGERVWQGPGPHVDWRVVVLGTPAVVDPETGAVLAVALGTSYWLRLTSADLTVALSAGLTQTHRYGLDRDFDATAVFGPTWVHGHWDEREPEWVLAASAAGRLS